MSIPITITDGPAPAGGGAPPLDTTTLLTNLVSDDPAKVKLVYPDPTLGADGQPLGIRSIRIDMDASVATGTGANVHARYVSPYDGTVRNVSALVVAQKAVNAGTLTVGTPSAPFPTPV